MGLRGNRCPPWVSNASLMDAADFFRMKYPYEGVGFLTDEGFVGVDNISPNPRTEFAVDPSEWLRNGDIKAVLHSHVPLPVDTDQGTQFIPAIAAPSSADMLYQGGWGVPGGIMVTDETHTGEVVWFGDQLAPFPLFGREFRHGVADCYSLIRDAYKLGKDGLITPENQAERIYGWPFDSITLPVGPRDSSWWEQKGVDLYEDNFAMAGFEKTGIDRTTLKLLQIGDIFFYKLGRTRVSNHAGLYIGNGLILHHVPDYSSTTAPLHLYAHGAECWIRYTKK